MQLVELCCSITDVIDSIRVNTRQYSKYGSVRNGYYLFMKYSIRILRERRGWLLSSQKAVWLLTIPYFRWLSLDFHLDRGRRSEYRIYWSVTPLILAILRKNWLWGNIFCTWGHWLRCKNAGYFNGAPYYIPGIKILELSWPFVGIGKKS